MILLHVDHLKAIAWGLRACGLPSSSHAVPCTRSSSLPALCCPNLMLSPHTPTRYIRMRHVRFTFLFAYLCSAKAFFGKEAAHAASLVNAQCYNDQWVACVVLPYSVVTSDELCLPTLNLETCIATESRATCHGFHGLCSIACMRRITLPLVDQHMHRHTESRATCHGFHGLCSIAC